MKLWIEKGYSWQTRLWIDKSDYWIEILGSVIFVYTFIIGVKFDWLPV